MAKYVSDDETVDRALLALRGDPHLRNTCVVALRGWKMKGRQGLFDEFAAALQFPYYFGENWNAFIDCIGDLGWMRSEAFVLVVERASDALVVADSDEFVLWLRRLQDAAADLSRATSLQSARPFHVILHEVPERVLALETRLRDLGLPLPEFELGAMGTPDDTK